MFPNREVLCPWHSEAKGALAFSSRKPSLTDGPTPVYDRGEESQSVQFPFKKKKSLSPTQSEFPGMRTLWVVVVSSKHNKMSGIQKGLNKFLGAK